MAPYKTESPLKVRVRGLMDAPRKRLKRRMQQHGPRKSFLSAIPHLAHDRTRLRQRNQVDIAKVPHSPGTNPRVMHNYAGSDIVNDIDHVINDFTPFLSYGFPVIFALNSPIPARLRFIYALSTFAASPL